MAYVDITGERHNKLVALKLSHVKEYKRLGRSAPTKVHYWKYQCDCGEVIVRSYDSVKSGGQKSCGCHRREASRINNTTHGQAGPYTASRLYRIWSQMKRRCDLPTVKAYPRYGGRGISVCKVWSDSFVIFEEWALANGYSNDLTIERKNNDGNYEPDNCRWADQIDQANNRRSSRKVEYRGKTYTIAQLSRLANLDPSTLTYRLDNGWSMEDAVNVKKNAKRT